MPLWGKNDQANNAPKFRVIDKGANTIGQNLFANTTVGAFETGIAEGVYGISPGESPKTHTGWILRREGSGPVIDITITAGGTGYVNTGVVTVSGGTVNATANVRTNGSGVITSLINLSNGSGFKNSSNTTVAISGGGSGAALTPVLGGRANRVSDEVLVSMGSLT